MHRKWAIRAGIGTGICALLTAWMVPNTTPKERPSIIADMAGTAEAQRPTYSAVPDSAIPDWAAGLRQRPSARPNPASSEPSESMQVADTATAPDPTMSDGGAEDTGAVTDPQRTLAEVPASSASPLPQVQAEPASTRDDYQARRAAWRSQLDSVMQGQTGAGAGDDG
ncbi:hypothetical protein [Sphingomonas oryzagri]